MNGRCCQDQIRRVFARGRKDAIDMRHVLQGEDRCQDHGIVFKSSLGPIVGFKILTTVISFSEIERWTNDKCPG